MGFWASVPTLLKMIVANFTTNSTILRIYTSIPRFSCQLPCGRKPKRAEKTAVTVPLATVPLSSGLSTGLSNIENVLSENRTRNLRGEGE